MNTQLCPTLCDPMDCSLAGCSVHGRLQARILVWLPCSTLGDLPNPGIETPSPGSPDNLGISKSFGRLRHSGSLPLYIFPFILHKFLLVPDPLNLYYSSCVHDPVFILLCHGACGILISQPGIELMSPTVGPWNSNHYTTREFPMILHSHCVFGERERG